jgi:hypothetical protein
LKGVSELFEQPDDITPLTPEEMRELIPASFAVGTSSGLHVKLLRVEGGFRK